MSQEIVDRIHEMARALSRRDVEEFLEFFDRDMVWVPNAEFPVGAAEVYRGHEGLRRWFHEWFVDPWEEIKIEVEEVVRVRDDCYVYTAHLRGRGRASGIEIDMRIYDVIRFRGDKAVHRTSFMDEAVALETARATEPPPRPIEQT